MDKAPFPAANPATTPDRARFFSPSAGKLIDAPLASKARFAIGDVVKHRQFDFRGVIFDVDPVFANSEEWYESIPQELRPKREQPYYHLFAENGESAYIAYVSQQNLVNDCESGPIDHPSLDQVFDEFDGAKYPLRRGLSH
ncbi:MAG: hypothetical protein RLY97_882 [Pseudomonadota bacterium]|jgi:heat shock protein HspQ